MILAALTTLGLIVAVAVNLWLSTASRVEPFYVAVDETEGEVVDARPVRQGQSLSEPLIQSQIRTVIRGLRVVYADPRATKRGYEEAFRKILPSSEAESFIRQRYLPEDTEREDPTSPPALVGRVQRTITDLEVTPIEGTRSYNIRWIERELSQSSNTVTERAFS
jgi:type IV secretory pathway TrbF-like protein